MRAIPKLILMVALAVAWASQATAAGGDAIGNVLAIAEDVDELELYKASADEDPAAMVAAKKVAFPLPILAVSKNGMLKVSYQEKVFWIIADDVKTDLKRKVDAACEPKVADTVVAHGKRGVGEGCD